VQWLKRLEDDAEHDASHIVFNGERFVVLPVVRQRGVADVTDAGRRVSSAMVTRKDGSYLSKLTLRQIVNADAGPYVCLSTNNAGYTFRRAHLSVELPQVLRA